MAFINNRQRCKVIHSSSGKRMLPAFTLARSLLRRTVEAASAPAILLVT